MIQRLTLKNPLGLSFNKHTNAQRTLSCPVGPVQKALVLEKQNCTNTTMLLYYKFLNMAEERKCHSGFFLFFILKKPCNKIELAERIWPRGDLTV